MITAKKEAKEAVKNLLDAIDKRMSPDFQAEKKKYDEAISLFKRYGDDLYIIDNLERRIFKKMENN